MGATIQLNPGGMGSASESQTAKPGEFVASMAESMENAYWTLLQSDGLQTFEVNTNSSSARDRRRLLVAISQGIVNHLVNNAGAFQVTGTDSTGNSITATVQIAFDQSTLIQYPPTSAPT